jgi:hypothetical protein
MLNNLTQLFTLTMYLYCSIPVRKNAQTGNRGAWGGVMYETMAQPTHITGCMVFLDLQYRGVQSSANRERCGGAEGEISGFVSGRVKIHFQSILIP